MPISFSRKSRSKAEIDVLAVPLQPDCRLLTEPHCRLIDVRSPAAYRSGFIPGSVNLPDVGCMAAARRMGLFKGRQVFLLADDLDQLQLYSRAATLDAGAAAGVRAEVVGWFAPEAIDEWYAQNGHVGSWEPIGYETLQARMADGVTLLLDVCGFSAQGILHDPAALRFTIDELPAALDGLPVESELCVTAESADLASFAASLIWNFGFHRLSSLEGGAGWW